MIFHYNICENIHTFQFPTRHTTSPSTCRSPLLPFLNSSKGGMRNSSRLWRSFSGFNVAESDRELRASFMRCFASYIKSALQTRPVCLLEVVHKYRKAFVGFFFFFAIFWQALRDQGQRMLNSIKHAIIPSSVWVGLTHRLLMAAHNQAPWLSTWGSGHTVKILWRCPFP